MNCNKNAIFISGDCTKNVNIDGYKDEQTNKQKLDYFMAPYWTRPDKISPDYQDDMSRLTTKPTKSPVRQAKTQIGLGIRSVWAESSLSAWRNLGFLATHWAHCEDSDQTRLIPRLIWVFARGTDHFVGFVMRLLILCPFALLNLPLYCKNEKI